jgi:hypothetical protein
MENRILDNKHVLFTNVKHSDLTELEDLFCGIVAHRPEDFTSDKSTRIYLCGNIDQLLQQLKGRMYKTLYIVDEFSTDDDSLSSCLFPHISASQLPLNFFNIGIFFRNFFSDKTRNFERIATDHDFQHLTESNKPSHAFRTGVYITNVKQAGDSTQFSLLRCSSNFDGPTEGTTETDNELLRNANDTINDFFEQSVQVNHVLAQIYHNTPGKGKSGIVAHADKTKDMPREGVMAFATFYDSDKEQTPSFQKSLNDPFHMFYNELSVFARLIFRTKDSLESFKLTLYPNSLLIIPLSTNRLFTHEVRASTMPLETIPTRMGYVMRCSKTRAVHKKGDTTYIDDVPLHPITDDEATELRRLYKYENVSTNIVDYGPENYCSFNNGDFLQPRVKDESP